MTTLFTTAILSNLFENDDQLDVKMISHLALLLTNDYKLDVTLILGKGYTFPSGNTIKDQVSLINPAKEIPKPTLRNTYSLDGYASAHHWLNANQSKVKEIFEKLFNEDDSLTTKMIKKIDLQLKDDRTTLIVTLVLNSGYVFSDGQNFQGEIHLENTTTVVDHPSLREIYSLSGRQTPRQFVNQTNNQVKSILTELFRNSEKITSKMVESIQLKLDDDQKTIDIILTLESGNSFGIKNVFYEKVILINHAEEVPKPTLKASYRLSDQENINQWLISIYGKTTKILKTLFEWDRGLFGSKMVKNIDLKLNSARTNLLVTLILRDGYVFSDGQVFAKRIRIIEKEIIISKPNLRQVYDLSRRMSTQQWIRKFRDQIITVLDEWFTNTDEIKEDMIQNIDLDLTEDQKTIKVRLTLQDGYTFSDRNFIENNLTLVNDAIEIGLPKIKKQIDLSSSLSTRQWLNGKEHQSFNEKIKDLFAESHDLTEENTSIDIKKTANNKAIVTINLKNDYIFRDGINLKTCTVNLIPPKINVMPFYSSVIIGTSIGSILLAIVVLS